jgi:hypothetical protein
LVSGGLFLSADFGVLAQTGPPPLPPTPLAIWELDATNWHNLRHEPPLAFTNLNSVPSWMESALSVDTNTTAFLDLPIYANGSTNLTFDSGSLVMWCQPNWTSATDGGTGPGAWAPLWQVGVYSTNNLYGCWSLAVSPDGNTLAFVTQTNGAGEIHAQIPIDWDAGDWHNLVITYCATNCSIFLEGALITNTPPIAYWPGPGECSNGFYLGSDPTGTWQAHAQFQELETYDVPLTADLIQGNYAFFSNYILAWGGSVPSTGSGIFTADVPTLPGGGGGTNGGGGATNSPRIPLPSYGSSPTIDLFQAADADGGIG